MALPENAEMEPDAKVITCVLYKGGGFKLIEALRKRGAWPLVHDPWFSDDEVRALYQSRFEDQPEGGEEVHLRQLVGGLEAESAEARREACGCLMCEPSNNAEKLRANCKRPTGPQRTYSIRPSLVDACGAIIILPPVNLLLLKLKNRQRRRSISASPSARKGNARRRCRARHSSTPST